MDYQEDYLKAMFGFLGITDVRFVRAEQLSRGADVRSQAMEAAQAAVPGVVNLAAAA
jgi:FMN-dependent NADH-azoreductase